MSNTAAPNLAFIVSDGAESARISPFSIDDASPLGNWLAHISEQFQQPAPQPTARLLSCHPIPFNFRKRRIYSAILNPSPTPEIVRCLQIHANAERLPQISIAIVETNVFGSGALQLMHCNG